MVEVVIRWLWNKEEEDDCGLKVMDWVVEGMAIGVIGVVLNDGVDVGMVAVEIV